MSLSANTNVASTVANYFSDNYTALLQEGSVVPATATSAQSVEAFNAWKLNNSGKQFFLEKSADSSYKLSSVTGDASNVPEDALPVGLNVAYAIESKELSLIDWTMARISDELRLANAQEAFGSALSFAPEADLSFDPSSMSQADLMQLLKRLGQASSDLKTTTSLGNATDRQANAAALGLSASLLGAAMEQQQLLGDSSAQISANLTANVATVQKALTDAQSTVATAKAAEAVAQTALDQAKDPNNTFTGDLATLEENLKATQRALKTAETARDTASTAFKTVEATLSGMTTFNELMSAAYAQLVAGLTSQMEAAQLAYSQTATSTATSTQLSALTSAAGGALNSRLKSAADLALLTNPAVALFSALDVQQTDDGYVINTSGMSARDTQKAVVRAALEEALSDPALQTALADAMAANADSLGTADMDLPSQTQLYNEVAAAVISSMLANDAYLDELASGAVDFGTQLSQMLGNELVSASQRDNALMSSMN